MKAILGFKEPAAIIPFDTEAVPRGAVTIEEFLGHPGVSMESMEIVHSRFESVRARALAGVLSIPEDQIKEGNDRIHSEEPFIYAKVLFSEQNPWLGSKLALFNVRVGVPA